MPSATSRRVLGPSNRNLTASHRVGFDTLPDQLVNRELQRGFSFNILCVGETGAGKSTLLESLFDQDFDQAQRSHFDSGVTVDTFTSDLEDGGVRLKLCCVQTQGYGDQLNREHSADSILAYVDKQFDSYLQEELKTTRDMQHLHDTRIHVCLFLLPPTGHSLKSVDLVLLHKLHEKVNVVPIVAKADTVTKAELSAFKELLRQEFEANKIELYKPETVPESPDYESMMPFAVVASHDTVEVRGDRVRVRQYPWGVVEVENEQHSDFVKLKEMLLRTHMEHLRQRTHRKLYERFRQSRLRSMGFADNTPDGKPVSIRETYEQKRKENQAEMAKREELMKQQFVQKVRAKETELKASEQKLAKQYEKMKREHMQSLQVLKKQQQQLAQDREEWQVQLRELEEAALKGKKGKIKKDKH